MSGEKNAVNNFDRVSNPLSSGHDLHTLGRPVSRTIKIFPEQLKSSLVISGTTLSRLYIVYNIINDNTYNFHSENKGKTAYQTTHFINIYNVNSGFHIGISETRRREVTYYPF